MKYFLIAGERSGDLHGAFLIRELLKEDPEAVVLGYGGDQMEEAGMKLVSHYREISFMGFIEVLQNIRVIARRIRECERALVEVDPDVLILIDFPGFNLRMARFAKQNKFKVAYYIAPKVWAWKESRVNTIKKYVDRLYCILPFEKNFFQKHDYAIQYVGNPVMEEIEQHNFTDLPVQNNTKSKVAYLPGSRAQEVRTSVNVILECARLKPDFEFLVAAVDNLDPSFYDSLKKTANVQVFYGKTYEVLKACDAAIVTSGTATLETALLNVPQVVCYRTSRISYWVARSLIKVRFLSLVNLIQDERILQEFVQHDYTAPKVLNEIEKLLHDASYRQNMLAKYQELRNTIGNKSASGYVASDLIEWIRN